WY
ncbi:pectate disaccharide-lyase domain protein, partial [Vibrio parahaemolyticus V-223/04]